MVWKSSFEVMHLERQIKVDKKLTLRRTNGLQDETQAETDRQTSRRLKMKMEHVEYLSTMKKKSLPFEHSCSGQARIRFSSFGHSSIVQIL